MYAGCVFGTHNPPSETLPHPLFAFRWACDNGFADSVLTLFEIIEGDDTRFWASPPSHPTGNAKKLLPASPILDFKSVHGTTRLRTYVCCTSNSRMRSIEFEIGDSDRKGACL